MPRSIQTLRNSAARLARERDNLRRKVRYREARAGEIASLLGQVVFSPLTPADVREKLMKLARR